MLFLDTYICSRSIKTCKRMINTIFMVVLTSEEGDSGLMEGNITVFRMSYFFLNVSSKTDQKKIQSK